MIQNTQEWHEWRKKGLGASEAPIVMGVSPYTTRYQLWQEKISPEIDRSEKESFITRFGHEFEIKAQARLELETGIEVETACVEHYLHPWLRASLDACSFEDRIFGEIKYMGQKNLELVRETKAPLIHHFPQIQHQFMVTGFKKAYYVVYSLDADRKNILDYECVELVPDFEYIEKKLYPELLEFWFMIVNKIEPEKVKKDLNREKRALKKQQQLLEGDTND